MATPAGPGEHAAHSDSAPLYVVRRGWHIDVALAAADLEPPLDTLVRKFPGAQYLSFGFGDRRYLMAKHHGAPVMLAALWPGPGLMLVTGLSAPPAAAFGATHVIALNRSHRQLAAAEAFIWHSLAVPDLRAPDETAPGPYAGSLYFSSQLNYSAFHTCNTWAAETLQQAGLPTRTAGVLFAGQVWKRARRFAAD